MNKKYLIKSGPAFFVEGSKIHNVYSFERREAALFTDFGAELKRLQIHTKEELLIEGLR